MTDHPKPSRPNILILCMDQWDMHMELPDGVELPALRRLESMGVTLDRQYCTVPICTPSRSTMWTGQHAKTLGMWDNTNFPWIEPLSPETPTLGHMMREQGYYTAFKGKWHLSDIAPLQEDALGEYGFADYQLWGDMFGAPLEGEVKDGTVAAETVDWLAHTAPKDQPWLLISSMVNPHDIMYFADGDEYPAAGDQAIFKDHLHRAQQLHKAQEWWDPALPANFEDDLSQLPYGPRAYKDFVENHYTSVPDEDRQTWKKRRNYLINCMRMVDEEFGKIITELDRQGLWENTVVLFTSDHGEMNGAHKMHQKGGIHFDEATIVNMTAVVPGGEQGVRAPIVGSHIDLTPTVLSFAGLSDEERRARYPQLPGRDLSDVFTAPRTATPPRGSAEEPGDGALIMWDGLHQQDPQWTGNGGMNGLVDVPREKRREALVVAGKERGAPDYRKRTFYRAVVDGRYKLVRWFAPSEYGMPTTVEELYANSDVVLHDLLTDPHEMQNIGNQDHPGYREEIVETMLGKLNALIEQELGEDACPIDLDMFGTRDVVYNKDDKTGQVHDGEPAAPAAVRR